MANRKKKPKPKAETEAIDALLSLRAKVDGTRVTKQSEIFRDGYLSGVDAAVRILAAKRGK